MDNKIEPNNIDNNTDQSRIYDDNGNRIENNNTEFSNNLVNYYNGENNNNNETMTKEEKEKVINGLFDKISSSFKSFFSMKKAENYEEYCNRVKNAAKFSFVFLIVLIIDYFMNTQKGTGGMIFYVNLLVFAVTIINLKKLDKKGILLGTASGILMLLSFNIISMIFGVIYLWGMICLMNCKGEWKKEIIGNSDKK